LAKLRPRRVGGDLGDLRKKGRRRNEENPEKVIEGRRMLERGTCSPLAKKKMDDLGPKRNRDRPSREGEQLGGEKKNEILILRRRILEKKTEK